MARIRTIKPEFWSSEEVASVSRNARLLFIGMWNYADDAGNGVATPKSLKIKILPGDQDATPSKITGWLEELAGQNLIIIYEVKDKQYYHVTTWSHQKIDRPQKAKYPPFVERSTNARRPFVPSKEVGKDSKDSKDSKDRIVKDAATEVPATYIGLSRTFLKERLERFPRESALKQDFEARVTAGARDLYLFHTENNWTEEEIRDLLDWVVGDEFWSTEIRTLGSIRVRKRGKGTPMKFENAKASMERNSDYLEKRKEREFLEQGRQEARDRRQESERAQAEAATPEEVRKALRSDPKVCEMLGE